MKKIIILAVVDSILLTISVFMTFFLFIIPMFTENIRTIFRDFFSTDDQQLTWGIISIGGVVLFSLILSKLRDKYWDFKLS